MLYLQWKKPFWALKVFVTIQELLTLLSHKNYHKVLIWTSRQLKILDTDSDSVRLTVHKYTFKEALNDQIPLEEGTDGEICKTQL